MRLLKLNLFLVFSSAIGQLRMGKGCFMSSVGVDIPSVGQLNGLFVCSFRVLVVLMAAIKKCGHNSESEMMSKSPFHGLARTAP